MSIWKSFAVVVGIIVIFLSGELVVAQQVAGSGTLGEAVAKMRSQRANVAKILEIAKNDPSMADVNAHIDIAKADELDLTDPDTRNSVKNYKAVQRLMVESGFTDLDLLRDKQSQHELKWIDLYIFGAGPLHRFQLIMAEWRAWGQPLIHSKGQRCTPVDDGWFVCPVDP